MGDGGGHQPSLSQTIASVHVLKGARVAIFTFFIVHGDFVACIPSCVSVSNSWVASEVPSYGGQCLS